MIKRITIGVLALACCFGTLDLAAQPPRGDGPQAGQGRRGGPPGGFGRGGRGPGGPGGPRARVTFESEPAGHTDFEKHVLSILDDMDKTQRSGNMNVPVEDGRLLRMLAESINAQHVVEIGTSTGYSGIWTALALKQTGGKLTTFEIDEGRAAIARENFKRAKVEDVITLVMGDAHENVLELEGPIDMLFLDADKEGYIDYLEKLLPKMRPGGLICAHNMNQRQAHLPFVKAITENPELETLFLHMQGAGMAVTMKKH